MISKNGLVSLSVLSIGFGFLLSASAAITTGNKEIKVDLISSSAAKEKMSGSISLIPIEGNKVEIKGKIVGLTPGDHGIHIHENGDCSDFTDGFKKSGGHFNPENIHHGSLEKGHVGDLGNIVADKNGEAKIHVTLTKFNLTPNDKDSILGKAIVIHAKMDDEKTDPAGNSGERIMCGVIR